MKRFFTNKKTRFIFATFVVAFFILLPLITFAETPSANQNSDASPGWFGTEILAAVTGVFNRLLALAGAFAMMLTSWILWASGSLLTEVLKYTVLDMSQNINSLSAINVAWTVFRDLANMFFIFILLYAAIGTILGLSGVNAKKMVVNIVIIALLINFSLFFTKIIIDASNIVTIGFYNRITSSMGGDGGLATPFMNKMGIVGMFSIDGIMSDDGALSSNKTLTEIALTGMMGSIFILVAAFVFFAANIMFIGRFVILIFLMILSPLAFAAMALPKDKYSSDWWKSLLDQALFAPAFLAMMYATLLIVEGLNIPNAGFAKVFVSGEDGKAPDFAIVQVLMNYIIIIVMIIACLIIAKKFGAHGSGEMIKRGQKLRGWAQGKVGRGIARAPIIPFAGAGGKGKPFFGNISSLDKKLGNTVVGNSRVGRFVRGETTGAVLNADFGDGKTVKKVEDDLGTLKKDIATKNSAMERSGILKQGMKPIAGMSSDEQKAKLSQTINRMRNDEIEGLSTGQITDNISLFTPQQLDHLINKSEKINAGDREKIREARFKPINEALETLKTEENQRNLITQSTSGPALNTALSALDQKTKEARTKIGGLSNKEIELGGYGLTADETFVQNLSDGQVENITKNDNTSYTTEQKQYIKTIRIKPLQEHLDAGQTDVNRAKKAREMFTKLDTKTKARLTEKILTHPTILSSYNSKILQKMKRELDDATQPAIRQAIISEANRISSRTAPPPTSEERSILDTADWLLGGGRDQF